MQLQCVYQHTGTRSYRYQKLQVTVVQLIFGLVLSHLKKIFFSFNSTVAKARLMRIIHKQQHTPQGQYE